MILPVQGQEQKIDLYAKNVTEVMMNKVCRTNPPKWFGHIEKVWGDAKEEVDRYKGSSVRRDTIVGKSKDNLLDFYNNKVGKPSYFKADKILVWYWYNGQVYFSFVKEDCMYYNTKTSYTNLISWFTSNGMKQLLKSEDITTHTYKNNNKNGDNKDAS
jgi:hypothetical protein